MFNEFLNNNRSLLIAPAGHGKTYAISKCVELAKDEKTQLILTHTHAGVASIKLKLDNCPSSKCQVETIVGFAQKYAKAFCQDIPTIENPSYYDCIVSKATELFRRSSILKIIDSTYSRLFVDEYQDCNISQHEMISALSSVLPTHILGDPMQGIFGFNGEIIDFERHLSNYSKYDILKTPWRWIKNNNQGLGEYILDCRRILQSDNKKIQLVSDPSIHLYVYQKSESNIYDFVNKSDYGKMLQNIISNNRNIPELNNLLIIVPEYIDSSGNKKGDVNDRAKLKSRLDFANQVYLLESIDNKSFYSISKDIDILVSTLSRAKKKIDRLKSLLNTIFNKTDIDVWFGSNVVKSRRGINQMHSSELNRICESIISMPSYCSLLSLLLFFKDRVKAKSKRIELRNTIISCLEQSSIDKNSVYNNMVVHKNIIRRLGRNVKGKCIGTTLLTKGLEFDTVVILDAHRFVDPKHFYVAISRACKKLIIFTEKTTILFN